MSFSCESFVALLFAIGSIAVLGPRPFAPLWICPGLGIKIKDPTYFIDFIDSNIVLFASESCMLLSQCVLKMQPAFINTLLNK